MLLTDQDLMNHHRQSDLVTALNSLLDMRMIPILNGNDAVAIDDSSKNVNLSLLCCLNFLPSAWVHKDCINQYAVIKNTTVCYRLVGFNYLKDNFKSVE